MGRELHPRAPPLIRLFFEETSRLPGPAELENGRVGISFVSPFFQVGVKFRESPVVVEDLGQVGLAVSCPFAHEQLGFIFSSQSTKIIHPVLLGIEVNQLSKTEWVNFVRSQTGRQPEVPFSKFRILVLLGALPERASEFSESISRPHSVRRFLFGASALAPPWVGVGVQIFSAVYQEQFSRTACN